MMAKTAAQRQAAHRARKKRAQDDLHAEVEQLRLELTYRSEPSRDVTLPGRLTRYDRGVLDGWKDAERVFQQRLDLAERRYQHRLEQVQELADREIDYLQRRAADAEQEAAHLKRQLDTAQRLRGRGQYVDTGQTVINADALSRLLDLSDGQLRNALRILGREHRKGKNVDGDAVAFAIRWATENMGIAR